MFLDSLPNFWTPLFLLLCNFEKSFTLFSQNSAIFYPLLQNTQPAPLWKIPTWFSLGTTKNGKFVIFLLSYLKANLLFFKSKTFFKDHIIILVPPYEKKLTVFVVYFGPSPSSMQLFCENKIKIIFVSWTEYFNVEVLEVTFIQHF